MNDVLKKGTRWEGKNVWVLTMLTDNQRGEKLVEILIQPYPDEDSEFDYQQQMTASMISHFEWDVLQQFCEEYQKESEEGDEFKFSTVQSFEEISFVPCRTPEWLSETTKVQGNWVNSNADVNGTMAHAKAQSMYLFWIEDWQLYGVIHHSYWCL